MRFITYSLFNFETTKMQDCSKHWLFYIFLMYAYHSCMNAFVQMLKQRMNEACNEYKNIYCGRRRKLLLRLEMREKLEQTKPKTDL